METTILHKAIFGSYWWYIGVTFVIPLVGPEGLCGQALEI